MNFPLPFWILLVIATLFWVVIPLWRGGAFWVPTFPLVVRRMLQLVELKPGELLMDLGSGDGRIPIIAAKEFGARAVGIEINFFLVWLAKFKKTIHGINNTSFRWQDLWRTDVSKADVIALWLYDWSTPKVGEKLLRECKKDVRVVSYMWKLGKGWQIVAEDPSLRVRVYKKLAQ